VVLERFREHRERQVLLELGRTAGEGREPAFGAPRERLVDQRGLPDPGLAPDDGNGARAAADAAEQIVDRLKLCIAPDEPLSRCDWVAQLGNPANCMPGAAPSCSGHVSDRFS
jgi:hypothetical protein